MTEQIMRENLVALVQTYATANGWSLSTASKKIHGNQAFMGEYIEGNTSTTLKTYFLMLDRLRKDWPAGVPWPETRDVPHPARTPYAPKLNQPPRGKGGRFLGKKVHKRSAA